MSHYPIIYQVKNAYRANNLRNLMINDKYFMK